MVTLTCQQAPLFLGPPQEASFDNNTLEGDGRPSDTIAPASHTYGTFAQQSAGEHKMAGERLPQVYSSTNGATPNSSPTRTNPPPASQIIDQDANSHVSTLTDQSGSVVSRITSVLAQAKMILTGENPNASNVIDEEEGSEDIFVPAQQELDNGQVRRSSIDSHRSNVGIKFLEDAHSTMTYSRRIALYLMKRYKWYNPRLGATPAAEAAPEEARDENYFIIPTDENGNIRQSIMESRERRNLAAAYPFTHSRREIPSLEKAWACK
jgi:hypothetical protein